LVRTGSLQLEAHANSGVDASAVISEWLADDSSQERPSGSPQFGFT